MTPNEISEAAPRSVLCFYLSKFQEILNHKQTYKGGKAAHFCPCSFT